MFAAALDIFSVYRKTTPSKFAVHVPQRFSLMQQTLFIMEY